MNKKLLNILKYMLSFGLAAVLVYLAFRGIDWKEFLAGLKATRWGWVILFIVAGYLGIYHIEDKSDGTGYGEEHGTVFGNLIIIPQKNFCHALLMQYIWRLSDFRGL